MSWHREWKAIEKAASDFSVICGNFISALAVNGADASGTAKAVIFPMAEEIHQRITLFGSRYESQLPQSALKLIETLSKDAYFELGYANDSAVYKSAPGINHFASKFTKFCSDFNYCTSDLEGAVVQLTARAFIHLQRAIVVDLAFREKWESARKQNEIACEKLGAVHLLHHGIWSFKVDSAGERTDLILGEPLRDYELQEVYLAAEGLVLTEWKVATNGNRLAKYAEALSQAKRYGKGALAAIELKGYRYLVIVSEDFFDDLPESKEEDGVIYRYINIATSPSSPSIAARKQRQKSDK